MKIDVHTHIMPAELPKFKDLFGYGGFIRLDHEPNQCCAHMVRDDGTFFRTVGKETWEPASRLKDCERDGIDIQVLSTIPVLFSYWAKPKDGAQVARYLNDHIASVVAAHPKRMVGLGTVPLQDPELAALEVHRCRRELGLAGVEIGSHVNDWNLCAPELTPFYQACEDTGAAIFVHPWDMMGRESMPKYWLPWLVGMPAETSLAICSMIFGGVFERFPKLRVNFAHGGGAFPFTLGRIEHGFQVRPDLCAVDNPKAPSSYIGKFWVDSLVHDERALRYLVETMGAAQITLGSDYPFPLGEHSPGSIIERAAWMDQATSDLLCYQSALRWLGLEKERFQ